jgi:phage terminase Nu1 subunit (DNA packaging protein)
VNNKNFRGFVSVSFRFGWRKEGCVTKTVNVRELAAVLGISPRRVQQLVRLGMPRVARGKYDPTVCRMWYEATPWRTWAREQARISAEIDALLTEIDTSRTK